MKSTKRTSAFRQLAVRTGEIALSTLKHCTDLIFLLLFPSKIVILISFDFFIALSLCPCAPHLPSSSESLFISSSWSMIGFNYENKDYFLEEKVCSGGDCTIKRK